MAAKPRSRRSSFRRASLDYGAVASLVDDSDALVSAAAELTLCIAATDALCMTATAADALRVSAAGPSTETKREELSRKQASLIGIMLWSANAHEESSRSALHNTLALSTLRIILQGIIMRC